MKIERFEDLTDWTLRTHDYLAQCMAHCADTHEDSRAKWLLVYLADHEQALARTVEQMAQHADARALHARVGDDLTRDPLTLHTACDNHYLHMSAGEIADEVFDVHNQVIDLYRSLAGRAKSDETRDLAGELLQLEEHETMRLAQQVNRMHEL